MAGKILIIDNDPGIRRMLAAGLAQHDFDAVACPDGISAIRELGRVERENTGYDYLITDIFLPDIDGLKILKVIKNKFSDLPVLVMTAFGDESLRIAALSEHNTGYIDKPFEIARLIDALNTLKPGTGTRVETCATGSDSGEPDTTKRACLMVKITDREKSIATFNTLCAVEDVDSCDAVKGNFDIVIKSSISSHKNIEEIKKRVLAVQGVEIVSASVLRQPELDRDVADFIRIYKEMANRESNDRGRAGAGSYITVDIESRVVQRIFTIASCADDVVSCDCTGDGTRIIGMISHQDAAGRMPRIIEKLKITDGVLRIREMNIVPIVDN